VRPKLALAAEGFPEVFVERVEVGIFYGCGVLVLAIQFASTLGLPYVNPVGGAVAGAGEALRFDESLKKRGLVLVAGAPIVGESFGDNGEYLRCEISRVYPGQYEKPGVVYDEVEVLRALLGGPSDVVVARGHFPCCGAETEGGQELALGAENEIADLSAGKRLVSKIVITLDQLVP